MNSEPLSAWEARCREGGEDTHPWPARESLALLDSLRHYMVAGDEAQLRRAAQTWALANPGVTILVRRLGCLRELFDDEGISRIPELSDRFRRALDLVTAVATERVTAALADAALTDTLTGVGNRRALQEFAPTALEQASRSREPLSVAVIDMKGLKEINDTQGHAAGDRTLAGFAAALQAAVRETDQVFRVGGDEFVVLLPGATGDAVAGVMARAQRFNAPNFSWGAAAFPAEGGDLDSLLELADRRLYKSRHDEGYYGQRSTGGMAATGLAVESLPAASSGKGSRKRRKPVFSVVGGIAALAAVVVALEVKPSSSTTLLPSYSPSVSITTSSDHQPPPAAHTPGATTGGPAATTSPGSALPPSGTSPATPATPASSGTPATPATPATQATPAIPAVANPPQAPAAGRAPQPTGAPASTPKTPPTASPTTHPAPSSGNGRSASTGAGTAGSNSGGAAVNVGSKSRAPQR